MPKSEILKAYGVRDSAITLLQSYLSGRLQQVKCNGTMSDWLPTRCGFPQGSFLGPFVFNIFVNAVNYSAMSSSLRLYADDMTQYMAQECPFVLESTLNQDIKNLTQWFSTKHLQVNVAKTLAMSLGKSHHTLIVDKTIKIEPTLKILGVTLDRDLPFKSKCQ